MKGKEIRWNWKPAARSNLIQHHVVNGDSSYCGLSVAGIISLTDVPRLHLILFSAVSVSASAVVVDVVDGRTISSRLATPSDWKSRKNTYSFVGRFTELGWRWKAVFHLQCHHKN